MPKYINADKLCEDLVSRWEIADKEKEKEIQSIMADVVAPIVVGQPSADVVEVKHSWWSTVSPFNYQCMNCSALSSIEFNFCPNCGADMRGETK